MRRRDMQTNAELARCDTAPIHIPGSIQPHGLLLVADPATLRVEGGAGRIEDRLTDNWLGADLSILLSLPIPALVTEPTGTENPLVVIGAVEGRHEMFLATAHLSRTEDVGHSSGAPRLIVELEPQGVEVLPAHTVLAALERTEATFARHTRLETLADAAAQEFRNITGYGRVMIYQFLEDGTGKVIAEAKEDALRSFLNHHFPASDIPRQARELYVRNRVRVIPDAFYNPEQLRGNDPALPKLDLSDCTLRSVAHVHLTYLANMGVRASASVSIVRDGQLWGLVACHHTEPRPIPLGARLAARTLAGSFARQVAAMEEARTYRERINQRNVQDSILRDLTGAQDLQTLLARSGSVLRKVIAADGLIVLQGDANVFADGVTPSRDHIRKMIDWAGGFQSLAAVHTDRLSEQLPAAADCREIASGLLYTRINLEQPMHFLWLRAERLQSIEWAGNPHKDAGGDPQAALTPRASFEAWAETVRGRSEDWSRGQVEAATRISKAVAEAHQHLRTRALNAELTKALHDNQLLLQQKDEVLDEANHRIQNSLALVGSFLRMQLRASDGRSAQEVISEAQRRISAIGLVHRRLHQPDSAQRVDLARYLQELMDDMLNSVDPIWQDQVVLDLSPIDVASEIAVGVGLIVNELITNAEKYAYDGKPGPIEVSLHPNGDGFDLTVADRGIGKSDCVRGGGYGTTLMQAMIQRIDATLNETDNKPGLRVKISV
ncbi:histidine kinase dimerization/phosphoacceptor domain -containing protein [Frigidibacter sp. MR17.24]|uniref:histidine kinase dimerization/phosphoacceptor domain -containing protein n=1 Tax=Frigidibacter sp. MR17.24 TaxID=3127345 RepID=UPI003012B677